MERAKLDKFTKSIKGVNENLKSYLTEQINKEISELKDIISGKRKKESSKDRKGNW